jgi:two-component system, NtrC family, response regulator PilR
MARVLCVEDDVDVRIVLEEVLVGAGHEVDTTSSVDGGCALIGSRRYDLVLTDGRLPDGVGMTIADSAEERGVPALIFTGQAFILRELAPNRDKYRVLLKPLRPREILAAVADALEN